MISPIEIKKEYLSIGEVSEATQVAPHVLRYWEREFQLLKPARRDSGHRKYSHKDVENILRVKELLRAQGFTIRGAKKFLVQEGRKNQELIKVELSQDSTALSALKDSAKTVDDLLKLLTK